MSFHVVPGGQSPPVSAPGVRGVERGVGAISAAEWTWCLDLLQPFAALLRVAGGMTAAPQRPGEEAETGGPLLNLYLVTCALDQVLTDHVHRGMLDLTPLGDGVLLRALSGAQRTLRRATAWLREGGLLRRQPELATLARTLAESILAGERMPSREAAAVVTRLSATRWPARVARRRAELPECFRGADVYPVDAEAMAAEASGSVGSRRAALLVVGLRPSGLYLAPLCAAALVRLGHESVEVMSLRSGVPLLPAEKRKVRRVARAGGWAVIVDGMHDGEDACERAAGVLSRLGVDQSRMCHAAPAGERRIDALLADESVTEWLNRPAMLERLGADRAAVVRGHRLGAAAEMRRVGAPSGRRTGAHALKLFETELWRGTHRRVELLLARGVGLGFFGYHSWLVAACLGDHVPEALGINEGVLLMRWEPGEGPPDPIQEEELAEVAAYVAARARRLDLGVTRGPASATVGDREVVEFMARGLGRAARPAATRAADAIARHVRPSRHAAIDGRMGPDEWSRTPHGLLKLDFEEHGFDAAGRCVTDPAYDLASAVVGFRLEPEEEQQLADAYVQSSNDSGALNARLAVHKLLAGWTELAAVRDLGLDTGARAGRVAYARELVIRETQLTRTVNGYLASTHLSGVDAARQGPAWVIDLDRVMESDALGFDCATPASVQALRALAVHGQQVFVASGKSLGEVRERCRTFGLAGGIAEHGAVAWDERQRVSTVLLSEEDSLALGELREALLAETDVLVDPRYRHSLSLFRMATIGRAVADSAVVQAVIDRHRLPGLEVVEGVRRTIVRATSARRSAAFERLPEFRTDLKSLHVVGARADDLGLFAMANRRYVVGGALRMHKVDLRLKFASRPGPAGLLEVAGRALHRGGSSCGRCRLPKMEAADGAMVRALGLRDRARLSRLLYAARPSALRAFEL
ncbi:MAG TPA: hypothetical protein VGO86_01650 [Candidatus Dormibacteraeota bacterium]